MKYTSYTRKNLNVTNKKSYICVCIYNVGQFFMVFCLTYMTITVIFYIYHYCNHHFCHYYYITVNDKQNRLIPTLSFGASTMQSSAALLQVPRTTMSTTHLHCWQSLPMLTIHICDLIYQYCSDLLH